MDDRCTTNWIKSFRLRGNYNVSGQLAAGNTSSQDTKWLHPQISQYENQVEVLSK